jgi:tRNA A58 N-methylase Trm61
MLDNAMQFSHRLLTEVVRPGDHVIDGTMGNGHDTQFLAQLVGKQGQTFSFDIQAQALQKTRELLDTTLPEMVEQVTLIQASHDQISHYVTQPIQAAIFNLGYLPGGDKSIITHSNSTIAAIQQCLDLLTVGGRVVIVCYYGHPGGQAELDQLLAFVSKLDQKMFGCLRYEFINQIHCPPILLAIERKKGI